MKFILDYSLNFELSRKNGRNYPLATNLLFL